MAGKVKMTLNLTIEQAAEMKRAVEDQRNRLHALAIAERGEVKRLQEDGEAEPEVLDEKRQWADDLERRVGQLTDVLGQL